MVGSFLGYHQDIIYFDTRMLVLWCRGLLELPLKKKGAKHININARQDARTPGMENASASLVVFRPFSSIA
jgi:hypothetical protein